MNRRSFLIGTGALSSQLLIGCSDNKTRLTIELLRDSLPAQVVDQFRRSLKSNTEINIALFEQFEDVFKKLEAWQKPSQENNGLFGWVRRLPFGSDKEKIPTDLLSLGDYWLRGAIEKKLIQPIDVSKVQQWSALPKRWKELVTRNDKGFLDPQGKIWGAPYRWGNTVIIYRRDKFKENKWAPMQDWADLWRPELRNRISLLNHPREVIGLVLKKLDKSYNETNLASITELEPELKKLNQQVKFYGSTQYIEPLLLSDTLVAVGWLQDILPAIARYPDLAVIVPQSGTAQSADVWVSPSGRPLKQELLTEWINFLWQEKTARQIAIRTKTHSPIPVKIERAEIQGPLRNSLLVSQNILDKSDFILPLPVEVENEYISLFEKMKS
ncbi:family 1 extracellular solute-binding protein [Calothrix sp. NIES-4071]|nr:family 1 extracellular solute-binding protein [Calothrix sp. NIES-4071]BAZ59758.1 family 1 extracellular solute-binding protein [Calothrix sp. NIES-4105]